MVSALKISVKIRNDANKYHSTSTPTQKNCVMAESLKWLNLKKGV
jgi:hypothetical protein